MIIFTFPRQQRWSYLKIMLWWLCVSLELAWYSSFICTICNIDINWVMLCFLWDSTLRWRHNERDSVSNHQPHHCLLNRLFGCRSKKTSKLRVTGLCVGKSPGTGEFPTQMASNAENVSIWWRHHVFTKKTPSCGYKNPHHKPKTIWRPSFATSMSTRHLSCLIANKTNVFSSLLTKLSTKSIVTIFLAFLNT